MLLEALYLYEFNFIFLSSQIFPLMFITASFSFVQDLCQGHCLQSLAPHSAAMAQTLLLEQSRQTSGYAACLGEEFRPALHDPEPLPESLLLPKAYRILCTLLN